MSIFKRLYDIARSEFQYKTGYRPKSKQRHWKTYRPIDEEDILGADTAGGGSSSSTQPPKDDDRPFAKEYEALEIPYGSDLETVRTAWKSLLRKYHPDLHNADDEKQQIAHQVTQTLNEAYRSLKKHLGS